MCEDYAGRTGGVPDLIIWHEEEQWAKFVEVKGPGDSVQENQKVGLAAEQRCIILPAVWLNTGA